MAGPEPVPFRLAKDRVQHGAERRGLPPPPQGSSLPLREGVCRGLTQEEGRECRLPTAPAAAGPAQDSGTVPCSDGGAQFAAHGRDRRLGPSPSMRPQLCPHPAEPCPDCHMMRGVPLLGAVGPPPRTPPGGATPGLSEPREGPGTEEVWRDCCLPRAPWMQGHRDWKGCRARQCSHTFVKGESGPEQTWPGPQNGAGVSPGLLVPKLFHQTCWSVGL